MLPHTLTVLPPPPRTPEGRALDIEKETSNVKHTKKAYKHYAAVAKRAVAAGHVCDIFACALDQVGLMEMRALP